MKKILRARARARGEKRGKTNQKTNLRLPHRHQSLASKNKSHLGPENTSFPYPRLLIDALQDPPTDILMRGEAGRSCDRQIKSELGSMMTVFQFLVPLIKT